MENISSFANWSDVQLLSTAARYGEEARKWKNKFLGLLPEIDRRKLWEVKGFTSITHFAEVVGGVSMPQVKRMMSLDERFEEMPILRNLLTNGEVSVNKLARIASVATSENEEFLGDQVQLLSKFAVETLVRDMRYEFVPGHKIESQYKLELAEDVEQGLAELQGKGIDINEELRVFLEQRKRELEEKKEAIGEKCKRTNSRYIPKATRDILKKEHGTKCSIQNCNEPWTETHHTQRFAMSKTHDPRYLAPVCGEHHDIAHSIDVKVQEKKSMKVAGVQCVKI